MNWRIPTVGRGLARVLCCVLALSVAGGPIASALHEGHHVLTGVGPQRFERHDEHAHHAHHALDDHAECALCAYQRTAQALVPIADPVDSPSDPPSAAPERASHVAADGSCRLPASRAPPSLS